LLAVIRANVGVHWTLGRGWCFASESSAAAPRHRLRAAPALARPTAPAMQRSRPPTTRRLVVVQPGSAARRDRFCRRSGRGRACTPARGRQAGDLNVTVPGWRSGTVVASAAGSGGFPAEHHSRWRWSRRPGRAEETERRRELGPACADTRSRGLSYGPRAERRS